MTKIIKAKILFSADNHFNGEVKSKIKSKSNGSGLYDTGFGSNLDDSLKNTLSVVVDKKIVSDLPIIFVKGDMYQATGKDTDPGKK